MDHFVNRSFLFFLFFSFPTREFLLLLGARIDGRQVVSTATEIIQVSNEIIGRKCRVGMGMIRT